jgi:hypothetical protein
MAEKISLFVPKMSLASPKYPLLIALVTASLGWRDGGFASSMNSRITLDSKRTPYTACDCTIFPNLEYWNFSEGTNLEEPIGLVGQVDVFYMVGELFLVDKRGHPHCEGAEIESYKCVCHFPIKFHNLIAPIIMLYPQTERR